MTKFFVTPEGKYIGGFDGVEPPVGAIEISLPPEDGRLIWDGKNWNKPNDIKEQIATEEKAQIFEQFRPRVDAMMVSIWEQIVSTDGDIDVQGIFNRIRKEFPKPQ